MHFIESIGPVLGIVAFVGLAALAFLLFQQARDLRRLREWAGRAPERAQDAAEAVQASAEASRGEGEAVDAAALDGDALEAEAPPAGRLGAAWARLTGAVTPRLARLERRLPVDGRYILAVAAIAVVVAGALTSGFGLLGGDEGKRQRRGGSSSKPTVAVLNGTDVPGLAALVDKEVVTAPVTRPARSTTPALAWRPPWRCSPRDTRRRPSGWRRRSRRSSETRPPGR